MMKNPALVTSLLGRRVRLQEPSSGTRDHTGHIVTVYLDEQGMHYVLLVAGRLVQADSANQFTVLEEEDW
jgi:hypothetical protein